jgi:hypothetical protein
MPSFYPIRSFHFFYPVEPAGCDLQHVEIPALYDLVTGNFQDALDVFEMFKHARSLSSFATWCSSTAREKTREFDAYSDLGDQELAIA